MNPTTTWYLVLAAVLFGVGAFGLMVGRNPLVMFMCIELMLNAANLTFVAFATSLADINGQTAVFFVMVVAAAEVVVEEDPANPGYYTSKFFLRPHYQLEGLTVSLRLVSKLPSLKGA